MQLPTPKENREEKKKKSSPFSKRPFIKKTKKSENNFIENKLFN